MAASAILAHFRERRRRSRYVWCWQDSSGPRSLGRDEDKLHNTELEDLSRGHFGVFLGAGIRVAVLSLVKARVGVDALADRHARVTRCGSWANPTA